MKKQVLFLAIGLLTGPIAIAATYYMPDDCANLHECFGVMQGGDTLIIRDGVYTGEENTIDNRNYPPRGMDSVYTVLQAENEGNVIFDGENENSLMSFSGNNANPETQRMAYILFQGLIYRNSPGGCINIHNVNHIKFIKCGFYNGVRKDNHSLPDIPFNVRYFNNSLLEDCYIWGGSHYGLRLLDSHDTILRRVVVRNDWAYGPYHAGIFVYSSYRILLENNIVIDNDQKDFYLGLEGNSFCAFQNEDNNGILNSHVGEPVIYRGNIALNNIYFAGFISENYADASFSFEDNIFWDSELGFWDRTNQHAIFNHCVFGKQTFTIGWGAAVRMHLRNSIIAQADRTGVELCDSNYNVFYDNVRNYISTDVGINDYASENNNEINIYENGFKYLPRIESGSYLNTAASDGTYIGCNILYKYGRTGTLYGEEGYDEITNEPLWPFPNEDMVKRKFSTFIHTGEKIDGTIGTVTGKRGFCADGAGLYGGRITLTSYIWEYLGNPCPVDVCNYYDVNRDGHVNVQDTQIVANHILGIATSEDADTTGDGSVTIQDVQGVVNVILAGIQG